ncbi:ABC transporter permease [Streptomyces sp. 8K308]|uniref:ABC transporter permease n=1 Tax=Streptomyces sp. 8K308 TaxID=2530388 RepID=UPI00104D0063|nr:ABC transporter permease [Streptomyces sp. 8K308]TDC27174.1 ABC transporter permease [Streptomyces sp. 8K308]
MTAPTLSPAQRAERLATGRSAKVHAFLGPRIHTVAIGAVLLAVLVVFSLTADTFLTTDNWLSVLRQNAPVMIVAVAMTFVVTTSGIDLSVGSVLALSGALLAILIDHGTDPTLAFVAALALGGVAGGLNGWLSCYQGIPAFIVTLATLGIIRGTALRSTDGYSIALPTDSWVGFLGQGLVAGIPTAAVVALVFAAVAWVVFDKTAFGRYVVGLGSNRESLRRAGVNIRLVGLTVYLICGMAAALAGVLVATRLGTGSSNQGVGFELTVITAVVLGGTSLFGGRGSVLGSVLGVLALGFIENGLQLSHVNPFYVQIVQGTILLAAVLANTRLFARFAEGPS